MHELLNKIQFREARISRRFSTSSKERRDILPVARNIISSSSFDNQTRREKIPMIVKTISNKYNSISLIAQGVLHFLQAIN